MLTQINMHRVLLSIGSNTNARLNIKHAIEQLHFIFPSIQFTQTTETEPFGMNFKNIFFNTLAYMQTSLDKDDLIKQFKRIEKEMGRLPNHKKNGIVIIDIDLIKWNDQILKPEDFKRDYIKELLPQVQKECLD